MRVILALCAMLIASQAHAFTCDQLKRFAAGKTEAELHEIAKQYGLSRANIARARACLHRADRVRAVR